MLVALGLRPDGKKEVIRLRRIYRIDRRTVRHPGYRASQRARKRIEEASAWIKTIAGQAKTSFRGTARVGWAFKLAAPRPTT